MNNLSSIIKEFTLTALKTCNKTVKRTLRSQLKYKTNDDQKPTPAFRKAPKFYSRLALRDSVGNYTYGNIFAAAKDLSEKICAKIDERKNSQVSFLCPNDASYVIAQWAIWMSGQAAVPLCKQYPFETINYFVKNSESKLLITTPDNAEFFNQVSLDTNVDLMVLDDDLRKNALAKNIMKINTDMECLDDNTNALVLYTSGSREYPKGVVFTHKQLMNQTDALVDTWKLTSEDIVLHTLPLNQSLGLINGLLCPLSVGAKCIMLPKFNPNDVWGHLLGIKSLSDDRKVTVFMGTPKLYNSLLAEHSTLFAKDLKVEEYIRSTLKSKTRLMTCSTGTLSPILYQKWFEITGHKLLQHYGSTETGTLFSQRFGEDYEHGYVGLPLKGCNIRIREKDERQKYKTVLECFNNDLKVKQLSDTITGKLSIRGDGVFKNYLNVPVDNKFTNDFWFQPGETCQYSTKKNMFKVLGKSDFDVIDNHGLKVSVFEIEAELLRHPEISDCSVLGVSNSKFGQCIGVFVVLSSDVSSDVIEKWMNSSIPDNDLPKIIKVVPSIPKNAMGKINKSELSLQLFVNKETGY